MLSLFRRSVKARAVATTVALSGVLLIALGGFLSFSIGNGLFEARLSQILAESEAAVIDVQNTFAASSVNDEVALQTLMNSVVPKLEATGVADSRRVALLRTPGQAGIQLLQSPISSGLDTQLITQNFRAEVRNSSGRVLYQSIQLSQVEDDVLRVSPGVVVGSPVEIPLAGKYELYLVFDLSSEQQTLDFVQQTLAIGGLALIFIIGGVAYVVTGWLVKPVKVAAEVSEEIANGALDVRLLEKGEDVIAVLARSFNKMADSLQQQITKLASVSKMQQRFVSDVSHELRTPLTTIKLAGDLIFESRDSLDPSLRRSAELLNGQIVRFETLLNDLLEISRYDAGAVRAELEIHDLNQIVGMAIASIEPLAKNRGSQIEVELPNEEVLAEIDSRRIERLLRNLLANAIEHGEAKPIVVRVGVNEKAVAVSVTDNGVGMSEVELERVFDRFWRADPARKRTSGGTGLGLAISLEDTLLHGGALDVWARPSKGASFRLTLPKVQGSDFGESPLALPEDTSLTQEEQLPEDTEAKL
jgi:two-component system, OmpR family, sensor histidine kinase MtrB